MPRYRGLHLSPTRDREGRIFAQLESARVGVTVCLRRKEGRDGGREGASGEPEIVIDVPGKEEIGEERAAFTFMPRPLTHRRSTWPLRRVEPLKVDVHYLASTESCRCDTHMLKFGSRYVDPAGDVTYSYESVHWSFQTCEYDIHEVSSMNQGSLLSKEAQHTRGFVLK